MKTTDTIRRPLRFNDLDEVVRDVESLAATGYDRVGNWDLAQVCSHLAIWMKYAVDGYPRGSLPVRIVMAVLRPTIGVPTLKKTLATGVMPAGSPTLKQTVAPAVTDAASAIAELKTAVDRFKAHPGEYRTSPLFGAA